MKPMTKGWAAAAVGLALLAGVFTYNVWNAGASGAISKRDEASAGATTRMAPAAAGGRRKEGAVIDTPSGPRIATSSDLLEGWYRAQRDAIQRLVRELVARGDAESLLDAVLLLPLTCDGRQECIAGLAERSRLLATAATLAPEHPLIAFLQTEACMQTNDCAAAYQRLAAVDPDNLFAYLGILHTTSQATDPSALDHALLAAAAAPTYDVYQAELVAELEHALSRLPAPSAAVRAQFAASMGLRDPLDENGTRLLLALGVSSSLGFPPLQALLQTCSEEGVRQVPARRAPCLAVMARMAASDTTLARSVGLTRLVQLAVSPADAAQWRERLREFAWVQERFLALQPTLNVENLRLQSQRGEWTAMREVLGRHGVPLQPPAGWLPAQARYRELLTGGG